MECFDCPIIQKELWDRINGWIEWEGYIPSAEDIEDKIISNCWCEKIEYKIWFTKCDDQIPYNRLTEAEWVTYCNQNNIPYVYPYEDSKQDNKEDKDVLEYIPEVTKRQRKRYIDQKHKKKLRKLWKECSGWGSGAYPVDINGDYIRDDEEGFVRYKRSYNPRRAKYIKNLCNRKLRRTKKDIPSKGGYRRINEYWWLLW